MQSPQPPARPRPPARTLSSLVAMGLRGHHPLFEAADIVRALREAPEKLPDVGIARDAAAQLGEAGRALLEARSFHEARAVVDGLEDAPRQALIRAWFRFLAQVPGPRAD